MTMQTEISILDNGNLCLNVPLKIRYKDGRKIIITPESLNEKNPNSDLSPNQAMLQMIVRGNIWMRMIEKGKIKNLNELVEITGYHRSHVWRILQVANLAPVITEAIIDGNEPYGLSITKLKKPIPEIWEEQKEKI